MKNKTESHRVISIHRPRRDVACYVSTIIIIGALLLGCDEERQPPLAPSIANLTITDITESSAHCVFTIEPLGATQKAGVIFGTDASLQSDPSDAFTTSISEGNITITLSSLQIDTEYYYKAYVSDKHNSFIYSEVKQFRTKPLIADVSATSIAATYQAGSYEFTITSNGSWTITSNEEWCTVQPNSGNGNQEIYVSVTENTTGVPRTATLTITTGNQNQQVMVVQDIDHTALGVSTTTINAPYIAGQYSFIITSNVDWTIASDQEWCTVQPISGNSNEEIAVTVTENATGMPRTATLTVTAGTQSKQVKVEQDKDNTELEVSSTTINAPFTAGQHSFTITSNAAWTITSDQEWCIVQPTSGNGENEIAVSVTENTTDTPRTATLTVTAGNHSQQVKVEQDKDNTTLEVSTTTISAPFMAGQHLFTITSNAAWTIVSDQHWCTVQPESGNGDREITVSVTENDAINSRVAILTVTAGKESRQVTVGQDSREMFGDNIVAAKNFGGGYGTESFPYLINNAGHLKKLVDDVNNGHNFLSTYVTLTTDIKVTANEWIPIGYYIQNAGFSFRGKFNGNGHIINGTLKSDKYTSFGFFGNLDGGAEVSNLTITASVISESGVTYYGYVGAISGFATNAIISSCNITGTVTGSIYVGGMIGYGTNTNIQGCIVNVNVTGNRIGGIIGNCNTGNITNCRTLGIIKGGDYTGGIAGLSGNGSLINNCTNQATITGENYTGGISGSSSGQIINCTNNGYVAGLRCGGIAGENAGVIHTSLNNGDVWGLKSYTGGLVGYNLWPDATHLYACCSNHGTVNGEAANDYNQSGQVKGMEPCPLGHEKR